MAIGGGGGGGASAGAIRAGGAFVELFSKDGALRAGLARAQRMLANFARTTARLGAASIGAGAAILAPLTGFLSSGIGKAAEIGDIAEIFGITTQKAAAMAYAFEVTGNSVDDLKLALGKIAKENTGGLPLDEAFLSTVQALLATEDATERATRAQEIFGRGWFKILDAAQDLPKLMGEAPTITKAMADRAEEFQQQWARIGPAIQGALLPLLTILTPVITAVAKFVRENSELARVIVIVGAGLVAAGVTLTFIAGSAAGLAVVLGSIGVALALVKKAVLVLLSPIGLTTAAVVAGIVAFFRYTEAGQKAWATLSSGAAGILQTFKETFGGIRNALKAGDLKLAWDIGIAGITVAWKKAMLVLMQLWNQFKASVVDGWHKSVAALSKDMVNLVVRMRPILQALNIEDPFRGLPAGVVNNRIDRAAAMDQNIRNRDRFRDEEALRREIEEAEKKARELRQRAGIALGFQQIRESGDAAPLLKRLQQAVEATMARGTFAGQAGAGFFAGGGGVKAIVDELKKNTKVGEQTNKLLEELKRGFVFGP